MIRAAPRSHLIWLENRTGAVLSREAKGIEAVDATGKVRGQIAYDNWTLNAVQAHMAVDTPIVWRSLRRPAFQYPFEQCDKGVLLGIIPSHNVKSVQTTRALGFRESHRVRDGWAKGDDLIVFEMRREDCRWIGENHG